MNSILSVRGCDTPADVERFKKYSQFLQWLTQNHLNYYLRYSTHFAIPGPGLVVKARMDYVDPEHKIMLQAVLDEFNALPHDD